MTESTPYLALHEAGLRNGSFYRFNAKEQKWAHYINGDFMGFVLPKPSTYAGLKLREFPAEQAAKLVPKVCV